MSKNISSNPPVQAGKPAESADTPLTSAVGLPLPKNWLAIISFIWAGQAVSMITSYAAGYAVVWYVTESTGSALVLAVMNICVMLPIGLLSPFGGIVADKHNRKMIMIVADGAIGLISLIAGFIILAGDVSLVLLTLVCVARAIGQAFHSPAMMATMPMLVPDKHLLRINTLDQLLASIAGIGAPAFGIGMLVGSGILMAWGGGKRLAGLIAVAAVIVGATTAACGLLPPTGFVAFVVLVAVMAMACAWFNGPTMTLTQRNVPDEKMGRAMGLLNAAMGLATPIGIAIGGVAAELMGVAPFFVVDGIACLVLGLVAYIPKSIRALDEG